MVAPSEDPRLGMGKRRGRRAAASHSATGGEDGMRGLRKSVGLWLEWPTQTRWGMW